MTATTERFLAADESVGAARTFVAALMVGTPDSVRDSVALMVSELATNALIHAAGGFDVSVERSDSTVSVSVSDRGEGTPVLQAPPSSEPHGRGLRIVDKLADDWGVSPLSDGDRRGKTVWFRLALRPSDVGELVNSGDVPPLDLGTTE
jgi:anti-sigma regulatory factor (Ser/Thr protein kinase)